MEAAKQTFTTKKYKIHQTAETAIFDGNNDFCVIKEA